jgi:hypothetical protein
MIKSIIMGKGMAKNEGQEDNNKTLAVKERARVLTAAEFHRLSEVPPAIEWFGNIRNEKTRRAYKSDVQDFMHFQVRGKAQRQEDPVRGDGTARTAVDRGLS